MRIAVRLFFSALMALTLGYAWTVGQTGMEAVNKNLCELWSATVAPLQFCRFNLHLRDLWVIGSLIFFAFLLSEAVLWGLRRRNSLGVQDDKSQLLATHQVASNKLLATFEPGVVADNKLRWATEKLRRASERLIGRTNRRAVVKVGLQNQAMTIGDYGVVCAITVRNEGDQNIDRCVAQVDQYSGVPSEKMPFPLALRTDSQIRGKIRGSFELLSGQSTVIPVLFRDIHRANEWYFFDEFGERHLVYANPIKLVLGVYCNNDKARKFLLAINTDAGWKPMPSLQAVFDGFELEFGAGSKSGLYGGASEGWQTPPSISSALVVKRKRLTLLEALRRAEKQFAWDLHGKHSLDVLDLIYGLHQAGVDADIQFFGKPNRNDFEDLTRNERLVEIDPVHWQDYELDIWKALSEGDNLYIWTINKRSRQVKRGGYADVHADEDQMMTWLATEANRYRGHTKPSR